MNILVVNDDGLDSTNLQVLLEVLDKEFGYCYLSLPAKQQSATSHAITYGSNLEFCEITPIKHAERIIEVNGYPADCVRVGLSYYNNINFDLVISGLNIGENIGLDITYSGTVSAAREAAIFGKKSLAISAPRYLDDNFNTYLKQVIRFILDNNICEYADIINVNIPNRCQDIKFCAMGKRMTEPSLVARDDNHYKLNYSLVQPGNETDKDGWLYQQDYAVITPLQIDQTDYKALQELTKKLGKVKK